MQTLRNEKELRDIVPNLDAWVIKEFHVVAILHAPNGLPVADRATIVLDDSENAPLFHEQILDGVTSLCQNIVIQNKHLDDDPAHVPGDGEPPDESVPADAFEQVEEEASDAGQSDAVAAEQAH